VTSNAVILADVTISVVSRIPVFIVETDPVCINDALTEYVVLGHRP
jgi:hypothetical protein